MSEQTTIMQKLYGFSGLCVPVHESFQLPAIAFSGASD
jgi:hypothetical protein